MARQFQDIPYSSTETAAPEGRIRHLPQVKRKKVVINNIGAKRRVFASESIMKSRELIRVPVDSIGIFCNEYVPAHFLKEKYVSYVLTINGEDHEIEPINSHRSGKKIVRFSDLKRVSLSTVFIDESIKSATLTIKIESSGEEEAPMLSNIKVLYGREVSGNEL